MTGGAGHDVFRSQYLDIRDGFDQGLDRITDFTLDDTLLGRARQLDIDIDIPAAARNGVAAAVRAALATADRAAYERNPERPDPFWNDAQAWGET